MTPVNAGKTFIQGHKAWVKVFFIRPRKCHPHLPIAATIAGAVSMLGLMLQWSAIFGNRNVGEEGGMEGRIARLEQMTH